MKKILVILAILVATVLDVSAQQSRTVSLQSAVTDSVYLNVQLIYAAPPEDVLKLNKAFVTKRGQLKREKVETGKLSCKKIHCSSISLLSLPIKVAVTGLKDAMLIQMRRNLTARCAVFQCD